MRKLIVIVPAAAAFLTGQAAEAGTIYLKNGQELIGRVVEITDKHVVISVDNGLVTISRRAVDAIGLETSDPAARRLGLRKSAVYETQPEPGTTLEQARLEANRAAAQTARMIAEQRRRKAIEHEAEIYAPYQIRRGDVAFRLANQAFERKQYLTAQKKYEDARDAYQRALTAATERRAEIERQAHRKEQLRRLAEIRRARERLEKQQQAEHARTRTENEHPIQPHDKEVVIIPGRPSTQETAPSMHDAQTDTERQAATRVAEAELERKAREQALKRLKALEEAAALHARTQALLAARTKLAHVEARAREREDALAARLADLEQRVNLLRTWLQTRAALERELTDIERSDLENERLQSLEQTLQEALREVAELDQRWSETATERDRVEEQLRALRTKIAEIETLSKDDDALLAGDSIDALSASVERLLKEPLGAAPPTFDALRSAIDRGEQAALAAREEVERARQDEQRRALVDRVSFQAELAALEAEMREAHAMLQESLPGMAAARNVREGIAAVRERLERALETAALAERPSADLSHATRRAKQARTALEPFGGMELEGQPPTTLETLLAQIDALRNDPRSPAEVRASAAYTRMQAAAGAYAVYVAAIHSEIERVVAATATLLDAEQAASELESAIEHERSGIEPSGAAEAERERAAIEAARLEAERMREEAEREAEQRAAEREAERIAKEQEARLAAERAALEAARAKTPPTDAQAPEPRGQRAQTHHRAEAFEAEIERALAEARAMAQTARLVAEKQTAVHAEARPDQAAPSAENEAERVAIAAAKQAAERAEAAAAEEAARKAAERTALEAEKLAAAKKAAEEAARRAAQQAAERAARERERAEAAAAEEAAPKAAERTALEAEKLAAAKKAAEEAARRAEAERRLAEAAAAAEAERRQAAAKPPQTATPGESSEAAQAKPQAPSERQVEALRGRLLTILDRAQAALEDEELARADALYDEVRAALTQLDAALAARREIKGFSTRLVSRERKAKAARETLTLAASGLLEKATEWKQALLDVASRASELVAADDPGSENTIALLEETLKTATDQLAALDTSPERLERIRGAVERARQAASDLAKEIAAKGGRVDLEQAVSTIQEERQRWEKNKNDVHQLIAHAREVEAKRKAELAEAERLRREQEALARAQAEAKRRQLEAQALEAAKAQAEQAAALAAVERARREAERRAAEQAAQRQANLEKARDMVARLRERLATGKIAAKHILELAPAAIEQAARLRVVEAKLSAALDTRAQVKSFSTRLASLTRKANKAKKAIEALLPALDAVRKAEPFALEWQQLTERIERVEQDDDALLGALADGELTRLERRLDALAPELEAAAGVNAAILQRADAASRDGEQAAQALAAEVEKRSKLQVDFEAAREAAEKARQEREAQEAKRREEEERARALAQARAEAQAREAAERAAKEAAAREEAERRRLEEQQRLAEEARRLAEARAQAEAEKQPEPTESKPAEQQASSEGRVQARSETNEPDQSAKVRAESGSDSEASREEEDAAARARRLAEEQAAQAALEAARAAEQAARREAQRTAEQEAEAKRIEAERKARIEAARSELEEARRSTATLLHERQSLQARLEAALELLTKSEDRLTKAQTRRAAFKGSSEALARLDAKAPELHTRLGEAKRAMQRLLESLSRFDEARTLSTEAQQLGADPARLIEAANSARLEHVLERSRALLDALERASTEASQELETASVLNDEATRYVEALEQATEAAKRAAAEAEARAKQEAKALAEAKTTLRALDVKLNEIGAKAKRVRSELEAIRALLERQHEQITKASEAGEAHPAVLELAKQANAKLETEMHELAALEQRLMELADTATLRSQRDTFARDEQALLEGQRRGALSALADTVDSRAQSVNALADEAARAVQKAKRSLAQAGQVATRMRETIEAQARAAEEAARREAEAQAQREAEEKARLEAEQQAAQKAQETTTPRSAAKLREQAEALAAELELAEPVELGRMALQPPATWTPRASGDEGLISYRAPAKEGEAYRPRLNFVELDLPGLSAKEVADQMLVELEHRGFASIEQETLEIGGRRGIELRSVYEREDGTLVDQRQFIVELHEAVGVLTAAGPRERAAEVIAAYLRVIESLR